METNTSMSSRQPSREFYLPAMGVISPVPGRIERWVTNHLRDHSGIVRQAANISAVREFYLPAIRWP